MHRWQAFCAASLLSLTSHALASTLTVSETGTFGAGTPSTAVSAAGGSFSYSFTLASDPTVSDVSLGNYFDPAISDFVYTLNGVTSSPAIGSITVFSFNSAGLFDICFTTACSDGSVSGLGLQFTGPQIYSGSESSPSILTGTFTPTPLDASFAVGNDSYFLAADSPITIAATPEPSSITLLAGGLLASSALLRRRQGA